MENTQNQTVEDVKVEGTGEADTQTADNNQNEKTVDVKTEAQKIADGIVAKKMKGMPTKEELKAFKDWQESKKTEAEKQTELTQDNVNLKNQNSLLTQKLAVVDAGVDKEYRDFIQFTVSQMEGEFEDNLDTFLKENPKYLQKEETVETPKTTGVEIKKIAEKAENGVAAILKAKHPELFKEGE